jgi:hypothetical protein
LAKILLSIATVAAAPACGDDESTTEQGSSSSTGTGSASITSSATGSACGEEFADCSAVSCCDGYRCGDASEDRRLCVPVSSSDCSMSFQPCGNDEVCCEGFTCEGVENPTCQPEGCNEVGEDCVASSCCAGLTCEGPVGARACAPEGGTSGSTGSTGSTGSAGSTGSTG